MASTTISPQDLIAALKAHDDFGTPAAIARASGRSYQTIHRWATGKVGQISQDDMADLVFDLGLDPEDFGVRPSRGWRERRGVHSGAGAGGGPPAWFTEAMDAQMHVLLDIQRRLKDLEPV